MNSSNSHALRLATLALGILALNTSTFASGGATDPIPGTSKSGVKSGAVGGSAAKRSSSTPVTAVTPAPAPQPIVTATLAFTPTFAPGGLLPACTGSYRIDPYYPTLSLLTVNVQASSIGEANGSALYITIVTAGGTAYPFTSNSFLIAGGAGTGSLSEYVTPGTTVTGVTITDANGNVLLTGK